MSLLGNTNTDDPDDAPLSDYMERKLARVCTRAGCSREPDADLLECAAHAADSRARKRKSAKKRRHARKAKKRCIDCGTKTGGKLRCRPCRKRNKRGVDNSQKRVDNQHAPRAARIVEKVEQDGVYGTRVRKRYIGQGKRGRSSREDESTRDINEAIKTLERVKEGIDRLRDSSLQGPARTNAVREMIAQVRLAERFGDEVVDRYEPGGVTK